LMEGFHRLVRPRQYHSRHILGHLQQEEQT
jgi:hypothetical protein